MLFKQRERVTAFAWTGKAVTSRNIKEKKKKTVTQQTVQKNYTSNPCADKNIIPRIWDSSPNQNGSTLRSEEVFFCIFFLKYRPLFLFLFFLQYVPAGLIRSKPSGEFTLICNGNSQTVVEYRVWKKAISKCNIVNNIRSEDLITYNVGSSKR